MNGVYTIRKDKNGFIDGIERDGITILLLCPGTTRNEEKAQSVVDALNFSAKLSSGEATKGGGE